MTNTKKDYSNLDYCDKKCQVEEEELLKNFIDFTLPGFNYLGPGSRTNNGPPTNIVDAIAQRHDEAYSQAIKAFQRSRDTKQSMQKIEQADQRFLEEMRQVQASTNAEILGKAVGLVGISLKAAVEKLLGYTLYPSFEKGKDDSEKCLEENFTEEDMNRNKT
uniref:Phospholipase A2-like domain-containing protein n=1 Tax=Homalodisca liturata TaxID=320908 RepID=A0A1B6J7I8_9HEMI